MTSIETIAPPAIHKNTPPSSARSSAAKWTRRSAFLCLAGLAAVVAMPSLSLGSAKPAAALIPRADSFKTSQGAKLIKLAGSAGRPVVYIGQCEVSIREYLEFISSTGTRPEKILELSNPARLENPACVSYLEATAFLAWLSQRDAERRILPVGWQYTLVRDIEWTLINNGVMEDEALSPKARSEKPVDSSYVWGPEPVPPLTANLDHIGDKPGAVKGLPGADRSPAVAPVQHNDVNSLGFVGLQGNVSELVLEPFAGGNPWDPGVKEFTVRGPNYTTMDVNQARLALRTSVTADMSGASAPHQPVVGFRIAARELPAVPEKK